ncbi:16517_t:CDS:10 [Acaulospora colombiana]|uniref:16517_t:CDS:1 n=1 Tax=Acaulospora colombiana TaxID=27376 RepID=A0ACA9KQC2_9GLOM|nr:16517_t:CDS:10 [Acaulospora colombiana]
MPVRENPLAALSLAVPQIFQECQKATTSHRKNAVALRKLQVKCSKYAPLNSDALNDNEEPTDGELAFNEEFVRNLNKVLPIKKGQSNAERVLKFVVSFVAFSCEKDNEKNDDNSPENEVEETLSSRFTEFLIKHLLKGTEAKDKSVRLRVCQLLAHIVSFLRTIDGDLYEHLKDELTKRLLDKEAGVRVKAVIAYAKLQGDTGNGRECAGQLLGLLNNDPSAEVRRAVLYNIEYNEETLPHILNRARDIDANIRCGVFTKLIEELRDFRVLSIEDREKLLNWGLTDRDPHVKKMCSKMLATNWIQHANDNLLELLERLDVVGSNVAQEVLLSIFRARPDITQALNFDDTLWENLTAESALLMRAFFEYHKDDNGRLDEMMPEITRLAFYIQKYNHYIFQTSEEEQVNYVFIVSQLLSIAKLMDYGDEVGMFRNSSSMIEIISDIRKGIEEEDAISRRAIQDDHDLTTNMSHLSINMSSMRLSMRHSDQRKGDGRLSTATISTEDDDEPEEDKELMSMMLNLKSLHIVRRMLEKNSEELRHNPSMHGLLSEIIIPNVQSQEPALREFGVHCLGLCCILDQKRPLTDYSSKNAINRFENNLLRYFNDASDPLDDNELNQLRDITEFVESLEEIAPTLRPSRSRQSKVNALANIQRDQRAFDEISDADSDL